MQYIYLIFLTFLVLIPRYLFAEQATGFGKMAEDLMGPASVLGDFMTTGCLILGGIFLFASILKYLQHRVNPLYVPFSTVVVLLILGIVLLCLPVAYLLLYNAPPYK